MPDELTKIVARAPVADGFLMTLRKLPRVSLAEAAERSDIPNLAELLPTLPEDLLIREAAALRETTDPRPSPEKHVPNIVITRMAMVKDQWGLPTLLCSGYLAEDDEAAPPAPLELPVTRCDQAEAVKEGPFDETA